MRIITCCPVSPSIYHSRSDEAARRWCSSSGLGLQGCRGLSLRLRATEDGLLPCRSSVLLEVLGHQVKSSRWRQQPSQHVQWWERNPWDPETLQLHEPESSSHDDEGWKLVSPGTTWRTALSPCAGLWPQNTFSALEAHEGLGAASINTFCWLCLSMQQLQEEVAGESSWRLPTAVGGGPYLLTWSAA